MNMAKFNFNYDEDEDILYLYRKAEKVKFSLNFHDIFVIDFNEKNKVVGLEIIDATEVIYGLNKEHMKNIEEAALQTRYKDGILLILIAIKAKKLELVKTSVPIPIQTR